MNTNASAPVVPPGRIDRTRLDACRFPSEVAVQVRFVDLDPHWHVNNAAILTMLQEARVMFDLEYPLLGASNGLRVVVTAVMTEYASELSYPGTVEIGSGASRIGTTSFQFAQRIRQKGRNAVYSLTTLVLSGPDGAVPLSPDLRTAIEGAAIRD